MPPGVAKALQDAGHPGAPGAAGKLAVSNASEVTPSEVTQ
jgi:cytochrome c-type biogenesis protein CcmE